MATLETLKADRVELAVRIKEMRERHASELQPLLDAYERLWRQSMDMLRFGAP